MSSHSSEYAVKLLDGFGTSLNDQPLFLPPAGQRLVAYLAVNRRSVPREQAAGTLWMDSSQHRAFGNLRSTVHRIHQHAPGLITTSHRRMAVRAEVVVDVDRIDREVELLLHPSGVETESLPDLSCLTTELLPGWYDDWVLFERERLRQRFLHAVEMVAGLRLARGQVSEAIDAALAAVALEPLRETPRRILVEAHMSEGNVSEAIRECRRFAELLETELGVVPTPALYALLPETLRP